MTAGYVCWTASADHLEGKQRTYAAVKEAVLEAGRFSVFEATESAADARLFARLCDDPELEQYKLRFPWIGIRRRGQPTE